MLLLIEGFEGATSQAGGASTSMVTMLRSKGHYTYGGIKSDAGRISGVSVKSISTNGLALHYGTSDNTIIFGFGFKANNWGVTDDIVRLTDVAGNEHLKIQIVTPDEWQVVVPEGTYTTVDNSGVADTWYYIECKIVIAESGSFDFKINDETKLNESGIDTRANADGSSCFLFFLEELTRIHWLDDVYICDSTDDKHNDFLGPCQVIGLFHASKGSINDFTPKSDSNYEMIDEQDVDGETTFNDGVSGDIDYYSYDSIDDYETVYGLQINTTVRTTDAESLAVKSKMKFDITTTDGTARYINADFSTEYEIIPINFQTSLPLTSTDINNSEFGLEVV